MGIFDVELPPDNPPKWSCAYPPEYYSGRIAQLEGTIATIRAELEAATARTCDEMSREPNVVRDANGASLEAAVLRSEYAALKAENERLRAQIESENMRANRAEDDAATARRERCAAVALARRQVLAKRWWRSDEW